MENKKGLINALAIDDNDASINYNKSSISAEVVYSFDALYNKFKIDPDEVFSDKSNGFISYTLMDGTEYPLSLYTKPASSHVLFLKIYFDELENQDIPYILIKFNNNHDISNNFRCWYKHQILNSTKLTSSPTIPANIDLNNNKLQTDYNGRKYSEEFMKNYISSITEMHAFAIEYCDELYTADKYLSYNGYLPSTGELYLILKYLPMINYIFKKMNFKQIPNNLYLWTSYEVSKTKATIILPDGSIKAVSKPFNAYEKSGITHGLTVLPLYKKYQDNE